MLRTLRNQLILSHVLPLLIVIPLLGVLLIYSLETTIIVPSMSHEITRDAQLLASITAHHGEAWQDATSAQALLGPGTASPDKRVMLLTPEGRVLASNRISDMQEIGRNLASDDWQPTAATTAPSLMQHWDPSMDAEIVDIFYPVLDGRGDLEGFVRVSHSYGTVGSELLRTRDVVGTILIISLMLGTGLGLTLAVSVARPLRAVTDAVYEVAEGRASDRLTEEGPEEVRRLLEAVNHLLDRLQQLEAGRRQLLANVVHELGRPLGALHAALQALQRGAFEDQALRDDLLSGMDEGMARLEGVVEDLSKLHEQVLGPLELDYAALKLDDWLPSVLAPWQVTAEEKGLQWQMAIESPPLRLRADPLRLSQALGNLVANAIKYTPKGGAVTVSAGKVTGNRWIWIAVRDTGPGVAQEERAAIFEPFFRGGKTPFVKQGLGLGLSIVRDCVAAHGGRLDLQSQQGRGSMFRMWLPASGNQGEEENVAGQPS